MVSLPRRKGAAPPVFCLLGQPLLATLLELGALGRVIDMRVTKERSPEEWGGRKKEKQIASEGVWW